MPRKRHVDRRVPLRIYIPESVMAKVDLLLFDPTRQSARKYNALNEIITQKLREWLEEQGVKA